MKLPIFAIGLLMAVSNCGAGETKGWDALLDYLKIGDPGLDVLPTVSNSQLDAESFTFKITNDSNDVMSYQGYSDDEPRYFTSELVDGEWIPRVTLWCGTGMKGHLLEPGESVVFEFARHLAKRQIYVIFRMSSNRSSLVKLWEPK